jgi:dTDP-4-amino-4,6-dideoxygalactose transaminase
LKVIEDACPAVGASYDGKPAGAWGDVSAVSMHPLKPLHVWGDGGAVVTNDDALADWLRLYRNHGMLNRDEIAIWGVNQRLQTVQAVVANRVLDRVNPWIDRRIEVARQLDDGLRDIPEVTVPPRPPERRNAFQLYIVRVQRRPELLQFLADQGVEAKVHDPIPLHLQPAARELGYGRGSFPVAEAQADDIVTLPCNQYLTADEVAHTISAVRRFYDR